MRWLPVIGMAGILTAGLAATGWTADAALPDQPFAVPIDSDGVQRVTVILNSYSYVPNHLIVEVGKPVELTLTSVTMIIPHNFIVQDPAGSVSIEQDVDAGKTVVVTFTPEHAGIYTIYCDKRLWPMPSHRDKGMEGILEVR